LCLAVGLLIGRFTGTALPGQIWLASSIISLVTVCSVLRHSTWRSLAVISLLASVSASNASFRGEFGQNHIHWRLLRTPPAYGATVSATGRVSSDVSWRNDRFTFSLDLTCIRVHASCETVTGRLRVTVSDEAAVAEGDSLVVRGVLRRPAGRRNPADLDFAGWLASNGTSGLLTNAHIVHRRESSGTVMRVVQGVRSSIRRTISHVVPSTSRDLPLALLLGDRSMLSSQTRDDFARSGLMHLLAISGLHVMLVGMMLHRLMRPLLMRTGCRWQVVECIRSGATLCLLIVYALASGSSPSVIRAVIMTGFLLTGTVVRAVSNPFNALGGAAFVILLQDPDALFQPGFQLSFSAVIGLLMLGGGLDADVLNSVRNSAVRWLLSGVFTSLAATLATAPALMFHFGYVGVSGIILNVAAIPIGAALLCSSILTCFTALLSYQAAIPLGGAVDVLSILLKQLAEIGASSDALVLSATSVAAVSGSSITLLLALVTSRKSGYRRWFAIAALFPPLLSLIFSLCEGRYLPRVNVLFLDVGHGDAAIVQLPNGRTLLVDAGNRHPFRDEGIRTVIPNLQEVDAQSVHLAVVSHPHADHLGGIPSLLENNLVHCVADNGQTADTELYIETMRLIETRSLCYKSLSAGDTINIDPLTRILVLAPPSNHLTEANDRSVVIKLLFGETSFLLTGDMEEQGEAFLTEQHCPLLASNVIKVPHHGSRTSSTEDFVKCAVGDHPFGHAIISVGSPAKYGLPDEDVLARWMRTRFSIHSTFDNGALWLESDGLKVREILSKVVDGG
ncbi:MAG TPA: DNA internalization-related competence protein ComEC/Rec2, partial [Rhodothermia bacterium]|nr:DNA internalization-related competence protein ComEC/Rec2 [Rhodothermia bacterium]